MLMSGEVSISLQISAPNEAALETWAIKHLEERGFSVRAAHDEWESTKEFCARLHIHWQTLDRNMSAPGCPNVVVRRGATGRLIEILSNEHFDEFITRNKKRLKVDRRDHASRMRGRRNGDTALAAKKARAVVAKHRKETPVVVTAENWKPNAFVDSLLRGKEISERINRKVAAQ